jgi:hypothetical protein
MEVLNADAILQPLLLVKAVLSVLCVFLFFYYRHHWNRAKQHLPVHLFFTKWRAVRHAFALGAAAIGFAAGFVIELFGRLSGISENWAVFLAGGFEIGSLLCILLVFFELAMEDVPHFDGIAKGRYAQSPPQANAPNEKKGGKASRKRKAKR